MTVSILLPLFLVITLAFGYLFSFVVLRERRVFALVPLGVIIGLNAYIFFVNLIAHAIPLAITVWLVPALMLAAAGVLYGMTWGADPAPVTGGLSARQLRWLFLIAAVISLVSGVIALRTLEYDDLSLGHLPLAATMAEGNFPVMDPSSPDRPMPYHYVSEIFTVALAKIAGTPLWLGYDIQTFLMSGAIFLMAFLVAFRLRRNFGSSLSGALLLFYGGGLSWLYFTEGIGPLWNTYVRGQEVFAPWKFVASMTIPKLLGGFVFWMSGHAVEMGLAVVLLVLYLYLLAVEDDEKHWLLISILAGLFLGYLALAYETSFVVLFLALMIPAGLRALCMLGRALGIAHRAFSPFGERRNVLAVTAIIGALAIPLALAQGGVLSSFGAGGASSMLSLNRSFWLVDSNEPFPLWSWLGIIEFGLPPLLFIPAIIRYRRDPNLLVIALPALMAFAVPFALRYGYGAGEMRRTLGGLAMPLFSFLVGMFLWEAMPRGEARWGLVARRVVLALMFLVMSSSLLFQAVYLATPLGHVGKFRRPFLEVPPRPRPADARAYRWIREHTTLDDWFFPYGFNGTNFVRETGRFAPGEINLTTLQVYPEQAAAYRRILDVCDPSGFKVLGVRYVYLSPLFPVGDFGRRCLEPLGAERVYEEGADDGPREIYRLPSLFD